MKRIIFLLFLAFVCNDLKAQIYHSEVCFYMEAGESLTENTKIWLISFNGEEIKYHIKKRSEITAKLKESADYWDDWVRAPKSASPAKVIYDSDLSTFSREVYAQSWDGEGMRTYYNPWGIVRIGTNFYAFSTDLSSFIYWKQKLNSETIEGKKHYKRIDKSELMPNEHLYDFLND